MSDPTLLNEGSVSDPTDPTPALTEAPSTRLVADAQPRGGGGRPVGAMLFLGSAVVISVVMIFILMTRVRRSVLPVYGELPTFSLTTSLDAPLTRDALRGKVVVADFMFLSCTTSCPELTARMAELQRRLDAAEERRRTPLPVQLVSLSVDPENDTPARLAAYAQRYGANARWIFATGTLDELERVIVQGFRVHFGKAPAGVGGTATVGGTAGANEGVMTIMHGDWFVLVDTNGQVRGYYDTKDPKRFEALLDDAIHLAWQARS